MLVCSVLVLTATAFAYEDEHVFYMFLYLFGIKHLYIIDLYRR